MRFLVYVLPFALTVLVTSPVNAGQASGAKAENPGAAQEFSSSRRKYSGPRGGSR